MSKLRLIAYAGAAALALVACGKKTEPAPAATQETAAPADNGDAVAPSDNGAAAPAAAAPAAAAPDYDAIAQAAVASADRPADDVARDADRKPAETLAFMMIHPGETVLEIEAGAGYYTELMSRAVGANGAVIMQNPEAFKEFLGDKLTARLAGNRLPNVKQSFTNFDALESQDGTADLATWVWGPHELYYHPKGASFGDPAKSFSEIFRVLKPGGTFVVIDHAAIAGSPETTGNDLHRIDPAIVKKLAADAGFTLDADADFLANPDDPHTVLVFDKSIRGHTDQFVLRFKKPA